MVALSPELRQPERIEGDRSHLARRLCLFLALLLVGMAVVSLGWGPRGLR